MENSSHHAARWSYELVPFRWLSRIWNIGLFDIKQLCLQNYADIWKRKNVCMFCKYCNNFITFISTNVPIKIIVIISAFVIIVIVIIDFTIINVITSYYHDYQSRYHNHHISQSSTISTNKLNNLQWNLSEQDIYVLHLLPTVN